MEQEKYRIAKIIDETAFIINVGSDEGISVGDKFTILGVAGEQILDPTDGSVLGTIDTIKGVIYAETIYPRMTICRTRQYNTLLTNPFSDFFRRVELNVDETQITGGLINNKEPIHIGDIVILTEKASED